MKKSELKPIVKAIIKEAMMGNQFRIILFGDKTERENVGRSMLKTGKGQLQAQASFPSKESTAYTIWNEDVLKTIESILQGMGWKRQGVRGQDIVWTSPTWKANLKQNPKGTFGQPMAEGIHDDWYVKEKGERMRREKDAKAAAKLLWGWVKTDRQMDFQKFFALLSVLSPWRPITEPTGHMQVYNPKPKKSKKIPYSGVMPSDDANMQSLIGMGR